MVSTIRRVSAPNWRGLSALVIIALLPLGAAGAGAQQFLPQSVVSSTVPANGDLNPYGVAIVSAGFPGKTLAPGDVLVSNFNNAVPNNQQGTGTTIVQFRPGGPVAAPGTATTFYQSSSPGLTTALGILQRGFVVIGNLPTSYATSPPTIGAGSLQFLSADGKLVSTFTDPRLDGPWDLTVADGFNHAKLFVSNVLNGTVIRLNLNVSATGVTVATPTVIAMGYTFRTDPAALVLGPTGLAYDPGADVLYVASTADNAIYSIPHAGSRTTAAAKGALVFSDDHLFGPLHLAFASNFDLLTSNGDAINNPDPTQPSEIVEFTKTGRFVSESNVDPSQGGAFGFAVADLNNGVVRFATVDDVTSTLTVLDRNLQQGNMQ
jgi:hypothetical protein